jgi:hypothetical protein
MKVESSSPDLAFSQIHPLQSPKTFPVIYAFALTKQLFFRVTGSYSFPSQLHSPPAFSYIFASFPCTAYSSTLKMESADPSETLVPSTTLRGIAFQRN